MEISIYESLYDRDEKKAEIQEWEKQGTGNVCILI
jgi:hypothetical protein